MENVDDLERKKIMSSIATAFDDYSINELDRIYPDLGKLSLEDKNKLNEVDMLLSKRVFIPGFYRFVLKKTSKNQRIKGQRRVLITAFTLSLLKPNGLQMKDLIEQTKSNQNASKETDRSDGFTRRHIQRIINEYYEDAFFKTKQNGSENLIAERFTPYLSVFSIESPPKIPKTQLGQHYSKLVETNFSNQYMVNSIEFSVSLQLITPEVLEDMQLLNEETKHIMFQKLNEIESELSRTKNRWTKRELDAQKSRIHLLISEFENYSPIFVSFYFAISSILAWNWLDSRRKSKRKQLLERGFLIKFSASEIIKSRSLLVNQNNSLDFVNSTFMTGLQNYAFVAHSCKNFVECVKSSGLAKLDCGILFEHIATINRERKNYELMYFYVKQALCYYKQSSDEYRICVCLKNLAEAQWQLGYFDKSMKSFEDSEKRAEDLDAIFQFGVLWNIAFSFRRLQKLKLEHKFLIKCMRVVPETETEKILEIEDRLQQLDVL